MNTKKVILASFPMVWMLLVLSADTVFAAYDWPWQQAAEQKAKSSTTSPALSTAMAESKDESRKAVQRIKQVSTTRLTPASPEVNAAKPQASKPDEANRVAGPNSFTIAAPQRSGNYEEAVKMQAKLNELLRLTTEMDRLNRSKVAAVQSMVDKARINQQILAKLSSPVDSTIKVRKGDAEQILMSKKLRGLREEAEKQIALAQARKPENASPAV